jgi:hypothetical protein
MITHGGRNHQYHGSNASATHSVTGCLSLSGDINNFFVFHAIDILPPEFSESGVAYGRHDFGSGMRA